MSPTEHAKRKVKVHILYLLFLFQRRMDRLTVCFDLILKIDWLSANKAQMDYCAKIVNLQGLEGLIVTFRG